ncbi:hypothetical protein Tco_0522861 [Tanacetum coccineum]
MDKPPPSSPLPFPAILFSVLGKFDGKSDEGFLVDFYEILLPVYLENQANPHAGISEKTNNVGTSQTPKSIASEEKDKEVELLVVPSAVKTLEEKDESRTSSTKQLIWWLDHDDSLMPELEIFHKPETGIFDEASYDEEGVIRLQQSSIEMNCANIEAKCRQNQELMLFSVIFKSSKETITKINSIVCLPVFYLRMNPKRLLKLYKMTVGFKPCKKNCYSSSYNKWSKLCMDYIKLLELGMLSLSTFLEKHGYKRGIIDKTLFIKGQKGIRSLAVSCGCYIVKSKEESSIILGQYVVRYSRICLVNVKAAITPWRPGASDKAWEAIDVDLYQTSYKIQIGSLIVLTASRPDIMESPFDLEAFSDSDYGGSNLDRKSITGGCQFLGQSLSLGNVKNR